MNFLMVSRPPLANRSSREDGSGEHETISLRTRDGTEVDVLVLSKRPDRIHVIMGEGTHSVFCELKPTADARAYVGNANGREIVYERSRAEVEAEIAKRSPRLGDSNF
jgi:hypothetical protein